METHRERNEWIIGICLASFFVLCVCIMCAAVAIAANHANCG